LCKFLDSQIKLAGMFVFNLLRKKYRPSYRMGSMYENDSAKFEKYNELFKEYAQSVSAGKLAVETNTQTTYEIERYKWPEQTRQ